jgi:hypothetical protein
LLGFGLLLAKDCGKVLSFNQSFVEKQGTLELSLKLF